MAAGWLVIVGPGFVTILLVYVLNEVVCVVAWPTCKASWYVLNDHRVIIIIFARNSDKNRGKKIVVFCPTWKNTS